MIIFTIDEMVPCLKDVETGEIYETEVIRLRRKSFLSKFNSHTGWYVNWSKFDHDTEIYALVLKGTVDIQGFVYGEAIDQALYHYYINKYNAIPLPALGVPFRFMLSEKTTEVIREVYDYEWSSEQL